MWIGLVINFGWSYKNLKGYNVWNGTGVLQVIADLLKQPIKPNDNASSIETRYHACTLLTNLSVGNTDNKKLIISIDGLINGLLGQLKSSSEELQRMAAGVLRNLSLNADEMSKKVLKNVRGLFKCWANLLISFHRIYLWSCYRVALFLLYCSLLWWPKKSQL